MIISFVNLKGGCGKSTCAVHLCRYLLQQSDRTVCLVDADGQETSSRWIARLEEGIPRPHVERILDYDTLIDKLPTLDDGFDCVVVDGAGGIAETQRAILQMSDRVIVPVQPAAPDLDSAIATATSIDRAAKVRRQPIDARFFLSRVKKNTRIAQDVRDELAAQIAYPILNTELPDRIVFSEAMGAPDGQGVTLFDYIDKDSKQLAKLYVKLFSEIEIDG